MGVEIKDFTAQKDVLRVDPMADPQLYCFLKLSFSKERQKYDNQLSVLDKCVPCIPGLKSKKKRLFFCVKLLAQLETNKDSLFGE